MTESGTFKSSEKFYLESGEYLPGLQLQYTTFGKLNKERDNIIWVCHAFSGSSDFTKWWPGLFGNDSLYNPEEYFVICANMPGGCYGSTGPLSINPETGKKFYHEFPVLTNRDIVNSFELLRQHLGFEKIHTIIGCSQGGQQAIEWAIECPDVFEHLIAIGANAKHSAWGIAFNETQRMAIEQDPTWSRNTDEAGKEGVKTARAAAMLSYRSYAQYEKTQSEESNEIYDNYKAASYQRYQGLKMSNRFNAFSYWIISKAMDSHNVGRNRGSIEAALKNIKAKSLFIGIKTDMLFPVQEQKFLARHVKNARYDELVSDYGHDGFLLEFKNLSFKIAGFYQDVKRGIPA